MLCILQGAEIARIAALAFTLSWTHSVERVAWEENWQASPAGLHLLEARLRGSGAGMEPPEGARLEDGWWKYSPTLAPVPELVLAASGATGAGWTICGEEGCIRVGEQAGEPVRLRPCPAGP